MGTLKGKIQGISLPAILQMIELEEADCAVQISEGRKKGYLFVEEGSVVAAKVGDLTNMEAVYEILCWDKIVIEILTKKMAYEVEIETPLMSILMEGLRLKDEKTNIKKRTAAFYVKKLMAQTHDTAPKDFRKALDSMGLPRSSKIRLALNRMFRSSHDEESLIASVENEAKIIHDSEDKKLLKELAEQKHEPVIKILVHFLNKWVENFQ